MTNLLYLKRGSTSYETVERKYTGRSGVSTLQPTVVINRQVVWMAGPPRNGRPSAGRRELPCIHSCELPEGLTFEQDLIDLGWHQKEFSGAAPLPTRS